MPELVLASGSPRRKEFLDSLQIPYRVQSADIDETPIDAETPQTLVQRLAIEKARTVALSESSDALYLGADTVVVHGGHILGKPGNAARAIEMLQLLSGNQHEVIGGIALVDAQGNIQRQYCGTTLVEFVAIAPDCLSAYAESDEPLDKAGGYAIQGAAAQFVKEIRGSYSNVVGLDIAVVAEWLRVFGPFV